MVDQTITQSHAWSMKSRSDRVTLDSPRPPQRRKVTGPGRTPSDSDSVGSGRLASPLYGAFVTGISRMNARVVDQKHGDPFPDVFGLRSASNSTRRRASAASGGKRVFIQIFLHSVLRADGKSALAFPGLTRMVVGFANSYRYLQKRHRKHTLHHHWASGRNLKDGHLKCRRLFEMPLF